MIWLDYIFNYYDSSRILLYTSGGEKAEETLDIEQLKNAVFSCTIDAGASAYWSEITAVSTLDTLLKSGHINFVQYLERMPEGIIPRKNELIEQTKENFEKINYERTNQNDRQQ